MTAAMIDFPCSYCGAASGNPCVTKSGKPTTEHGARFNAEWAANHCDAGTTIGSYPGEGHFTCRLMRNHPGDHCAYVVWPREETGFAVTQEAQPE